MATGKRGRPPKQTPTQKISSALNIAQDELTTLMPIAEQNKFVPVIQSPEIIVESAPKIAKDVKDDYEFARTNLYSLLSKGTELLDGVSELAASTDHPRTYEVAGVLLKTLIEGTRELMTLQKDIREVEKKSGVDTAPVNIENAGEVNQYVMEGTTMEMLDALAEIRRKKIENQENKEQSS